MTVELHPEWRNAAAKFEASGFAPGDLLTFEWLHAAFGMKAPDQADTVAEYQRLQLRFLGQFKAFERWLEEEQMRALRSRPGVGYEIVRAADQARWAMEAFTDRMAKEMRRATRRVAFTRVEELTGDQRRQHTDAAAALGRLRGLLAPKVRPPLPHEVNEDG